MSRRFPADRATDPAAVKDSMKLPPTLSTPRLRLRPWRDEDLVPFAAINADPEVMEYFPSVLTREQSNAVAAKIRQEMEERGHGLWAVEEPGVVEFAGFVGLSVPRFDAPFMPCIEIGWRLARPCWGRGLATEAARAALAFGFDELGLLEIVSFTASANRASRRVMEKLGMVRDPADDFDHPFLAEGHWLRRHLLYRLNRERFRGDG